MRKYFALTGIVLLCSCFKPTMMTMQSFDAVQVGSSSATLVQENGEPSSIKAKNGTEEYLYVEKITSGNRLLYENHYTIFVKENVVVGKSATQERIPAFDLIYQDDPNHHQYP
jgi:hypothetical protein